MPFDPRRTHKTCPKCRRRLPIKRFDRCSSMPDGRLAYCHPCKLAYDRARRKLKPPKRRRLSVSAEARAAIERSTERKVCKSCKEEKPLHRFSAVPRASGKPAVAARCKACKVLDAAEWRRRKGR